ncbi:hypothetical protein [Shimia thalassica]|uniref:hypothetical protein n=1 Tax=Shimia thalassica TaxID=1715693 RepID=UPI0026E23E1B|nr:hypothetical protein [Shimia thalassica]MDO6478449.1 hypothetical protein [Shimia thalassica]
MRIEAKDMKAGESQKVDVREIAAPELEKLAFLELSNQELKARIDNLSVSADVKALLFKMAKGVLRVGSTVIKIGQKIIESIFQVLKRFPNASFGLVFGAIAGSLVTSVPIIGFILGPVVTPLFAAFGLVFGANADFADQAVERRVKEALATFEPLRA